MSNPVFSMLASCLVAQRPSAGLGSAVLLLGPTYIHLVGFWSSPASVIGCVSQIGVDACLFLLLPDFPLLSDPLNNSD